MTQLKNKIAIVTGAAGGFGEGIARLFVAEGARVLIADLDEGKARKLADKPGLAKFPWTLQQSAPKMCRHQRTTGTRP